MEEEDKTMLEYYTGLIKKAKLFKQAYVNETKGDITIKEAISLVVQIEIELALVDLDTIDESLSHISETLKDTE